MSQWILLAVLLVASSLLGSLFIAFFVGLYLSWDLRLYPDFCPNLRVDVVLILVGAMLLYFAIAMVGLASRLHIRESLGLRWAGVEDILVWVFIPMCALVQETVEIDKLLSSRTSRPRESSEEPLVSDGVRHHRIYTYPDL